MSTLPHPIQYQGSKRHLAKQILPYFPNDIAHLYEPFAGSAAMTIAASSLGLAKHFHINDYNKPLMKLLENMVAAPHQTSQKYESIWNNQGEDEVSSVRHFNMIREQFNQTHEPELLLYLLARCVKGAVRYNRQGQFNQSPDKRRRGTRPETMLRNITGMSYLLKGRSSFSSVDFSLSTVKAAVLDLVYLDPPYQGVCTERDARYASGIEHQNFVNYLHGLNDRSISYIVSYDGTLGSKSYGQAMPSSLQLKHLLLTAGQSSTATLLGRKEITVESLYLSPALVKRLAAQSRNEKTYESEADLFEIVS